MFKILEEEKTPEQWKVARILPLFKKGDKCSLNANMINYKLI
jgi:hypothetical protein